DVGGRNIAHVEAGAGAGAGPVVVRKGDGDSISARGWRIQIVMADAAEREHAGGEVDARVAAAVAPVDVDRVRVERARVAEAAAEPGAVVFVDGGSAQRQLHGRRRDVVDCDAGAAGAAGAAVVGHGGGDGIAAARRV